MGVTRRKKYKNRAGNNTFQTKYILDWELKLKIKTRKGNGTDRDRNRCKSSSLTFGGF